MKEGKEGSESEREQVEHEKASAARKRKRIVLRSRSTSHLVLSLIARQPHSLAAIGGT